jgi:hypothetical protein
MTSQKSQTFVTGKRKRKKANRFENVQALGNGSLRDFLEQYKILDILGCGIESSH